MNLDVPTILDILRRRLWIILAVVSIGLTATVCFVSSLPTLYKSGAFILVQGQQIPQSFVSSTVTSDLRSRLHAISQEIMSRGRLLELIQRFDLYPELRTELSTDKLLEIMREDIQINLNSGHSFGDRSNVAFEVGYVGGDPDKIVSVANQLASFYIDENLKLRAQQAQGTSAFLQQELRDVEKRLRAQEQELARYKQEHLGELPDQLQTNLRILERLQLQLQILADRLTRARERRGQLLNEIAQVAVPVRIGEDTPVSLPVTVETLRQELLGLRTRFSDKHPDVVAMQRQIELLEEKLERQKAERELLQSSAGPMDIAADNPLVRPLKEELARIDAEIRHTNLDIARTEKEIELHAKRVERAPKHELELISITRDYDSTRTLYDSLLKRQEEANLSQEMEKSQKGERFQILDPAISVVVAGPNRIRLMAMGTLASLALAAGLVLLLEFLTVSFHRIEELEAHTNFPVLATIPRIITRQDRRRTLMRRSFAVAGLFLMLPVVGAASHALARENEKLVRRLSGSLQGVELR